MASGYRNGPHASYRSGDDMQYNDDAQLDTSVVEDARSGSGGGIGGFGLGGIAAGGGGLGIIGVIVVVLINVLGGGGSSGLPSGMGGLDGVGVGGNTSAVDNAQLQTSCKTGKDANTRTDCALVADIESIEDYWGAALPGGASYRHAPTRFFRGQTSTGCGAADSGVGPFYCPADKKVYIDLSFFDELKTRFGATGGAFVNAYVLAHEYGHHVQDLLGVEDRIDHSRDRCQVGFGAAGAAGRLLRRQLGQPRHHGGRRRTADRSSPTSARPTSPPRWTPPAGSATTGSSRIWAAGRSTRTPSRTARRRSGRSGSRPATRPASRPAATPSRPTTWVSGFALPGPACRSGGRRGA